MLPVRDSQMEKVPAKESNLFYYGSENTRRSRIDTYQTTNSIFTLNTMAGQTTATVIIPANAGMSHIVLAVKLPEANSKPGLTYSGLALPSGWIYNMIEQISFRYAGSSTYTATGEQLRVCAALNAGNAGEKEQLMSGFGGNALVQVSDFKGAGLHAYLPLSLPHISTQSGTEVPMPLDSSMMNGPLTITIQFKSIQEQFAQNQVVNTPISTIPNEFADAYVQLRQIFPIFSDDRMVLKNGQVYNYPITFYQSENQILLNKEQGTVNLVGIKSGQCKGVIVYVTKDKASPDGDDDTRKANASKYIGFQESKMSYAGTVLHWFKGHGAGALMDTLFEDSPCYFQTASISKGGAQAGGWVSTPNKPYDMSYFQNYPFVQRYEQISNEVMLQNGCKVDNGSIQLEYKLAEFEAGATYTLRFVPVFQAALSFTAGGSVEYLF